MAEDIGSLVVKVGMDSRLFQEGVSTLNKKMGLLKSEFQATASNVKVFGNSTEQMKIKVEYLSKTVDIQKAKVQQLAEAYEKTKAATGEYSDQTVKAGTALNKAISYLNSLEQQLGDTTRSLATQTSGWRKLSDSMHSASEKMKSTGQALAGIGMGLTTRVTIPILGIGAAATKMAMDAVESENLFEVSFGNMAESARTWSKDVSKSLKLNEYEVRKNAATYYVMLESMGLSSEKALGMSKSFTQLAYDMASFYNLKPEEAFEKLKAGITGETEPLKALGVLINETTVEAYAMEKGIGKLTKTKKGFKLELSETDKVMARYGLIMQATEKAQGDLARTMDSPTNKLRIQTEQIKQQAIELGTKLMPLMEKGLDIVSDVVDWLNSLNDEQRDMIIKFGLAAAAAGPLINTLGNITLVGGGVVSSVGKMAGALTATRVATTTAAAATTASAGAFAGLGASIGGLALAAAPYLLAGAAIAGTGYLIYKGLTEETVPAIDLFADKIETTAENINYYSDEMTTEVQTSVTKISDATKKAVGAYIKMDDEATSSLRNLYVNSTVITNDTVKSLVGKYSNMTSQIKSSMDKHYSDQLATMSAFFKNSAALSDAEEKDALTKLQQSNDTQKAEVDKYTKDIQAILDKASKEKRALTLEEQQKINDIQNTMKINAVKALSDTEVESKVILERLKDYGTRITAEQASNEIKNANKARDGSIKAANEQYDKTVAQIIRMRDESHSITADQADKLIADAQRQKDETVKKANELRDGVVSKITGMNSEIEKSVDTSSGNILTRWDKLKKWWNDWKPAQKEFNYDMTSSNPNYRMIDENWSGTRSFQGGLTTLHEKGYEVYDLPRGTRIYNHAASQDLALKTASQVAASVLRNIDTSGSGASQIIVPLYLDGKQIAMASAPYSDRISGNNLKISGRGAGLR